MRYRSLAAIALLSILTFGSLLPAHGAGDWRKEFPEITIGVVTGENEADRTARWKPVLEYLARELKVKANWRPAADYAGVIEGMKAGKVDLALLGAAAYAKCWIVTNGQVEPILGETDQDGNFGYHSIIVVKADSPYKTLQDLKGKKLA